MKFIENWPIKKFSQKSLKPNGMNRKIPEIKIMIHSIGRYLERFS